MKIRELIVWNQVKTVDDFRFQSIYSKFKSTINLVSYYKLSEITTSIFDRAKCSFTFTSSCATDLSSYSFVVFEID